MKKSPSPTKTSSPKVQPEETCEPRTPKSLFSHRPLVRTLSRKHHTLKRVASRSLEALADFARGGKRQTQSSSPSSPSSPGSSPPPHQTASIGASKSGHRISYPKLLGSSLNFGRTDVNEGERDNWGVRNTHRQQRRPMEMEEEGPVSRFSVSLSSLALSIDTPNLTNSSTYTSSSATLPDYLYAPPTPSPQYPPRRQSFSPYARMLLPPLALSTTECSDKHRMIGPWFVEEFDDEFEYAGREGTEGMEVMETDVEMHPVAIGDLKKDARVESDSHVSPGFVVRRSV